MEQEPQRGLSWPLPRNRGRITFAGAEDRALAKQVCGKLVCLGEQSFGKLRTGSERRHRRRCNGGRAVMALPAAFASCTVQNAINSYPVIAANPAANQSVNFAITTPRENRGERFPIYLNVFWVLFSSMTKFRFLQMNLFCASPIRGSNLFRLFLAS